MADICVTLPAVIGVVEVPAHFALSIGYGWDAGANSVDELDGDVRVVSDMPKVIGVVWGFTQDRDGNPGKERITHGFYFSQSASKPQYQVMENGVAITGKTLYVASTDVFEIRRQGSTVSYRVNGKQVFISRVASSGELSVGSALYASTDEIP